MRTLALAALATLGLCWSLGQPVVGSAGQFLANGPLAARARCRRTTRRPTPRSGSARSSTSTRASRRTTPSAAPPATTRAPAGPTTSHRHRHQRPGRRPQLGHDHQLRPTCASSSGTAAPARSRSRRSGRSTTRSRWARRSRTWSASSTPSRATASSSSGSSAPTSTTDGIAKAIAAFERTIVSGPSPYDRYLQGERDAP